jgi:hypothetical protein
MVKQVPPVAGSNVENINNVKSKKEKRGLIKRMTQPEMLLNIPMDEGRGNIHYTVRDGYYL